MKHKSLFILLFLLTFFTVRSEALPFRSGLILAAELSSARQVIQDFTEADYPDLPRENRIYASVTLKLFPGRQLSRHDYSLHVFGSPNPCVAIRVNKGPWKSVSGDIEYPEENKTYSMLFILDGVGVGLNDLEKYVLKSNYPPAKAPACEIYFTNRRKENFTPADKIPATGIVAVKK